MRRRATSRDPFWAWETLPAGLLASLVGAGYAIAVVVTFFGAEGRWLYELGDWPSWLRLTVTLGGIGIAGGWTILVVTGLVARRRYRRHHSENAASVEPDSPRNSDRDRDPPGRGLT